MLVTYPENEAESSGLKTLARAWGITAHAFVLSPSRSGTTWTHHLPGSSFCLSVPLLPLFLSKSRLLTERRQDWEQTQKVQSRGG